MKKIILNWLFGGQSGSQYKTYRIPKSDILQKVLLKSTEPEIDISYQHAVLVQVPFIVGVCLDIQSKIQENYTIEIQSGSKHLSSSKCKVHSSVEIENCKIIFLEIISNKYSNISWVRQKSLLYFFYRSRRNKVLVSELDGFFATYSFPREVVVTSFYSDAHFNIFPMDLIGNWSEKGLFILGLRNTNVTLKELLKHKKFVVSNVDAREKENIFYLGSHHSTAPPSPDKLPFELLQTESYQMYIPKFAKEYRELEIINHYRIGSHTVMICSIQNHVVINLNYASLYHQHIGVALREEVTYEEG